MQANNTYRYTYMIPREGFPDLPPMSDPILVSEGPHTVQVQSSLSESYAVCNIQAAASGDNALIMFESDDLLDVYEVADRLEELRLTNIHMGIGNDEQDFADAVVSIQENGPQMER